MGSGRCASSAEPQEGKSDEQQAGIRTATGGQGATAAPFVGELAGSVHADLARTAELIATRRSARAAAADLTVGAGDHFAAIDAAAFYAGAPLAAYLV